MKFLGDLSNSVKGWFDNLLYPAGWFDQEWTQSAAEVHTGTVVVHGGGVVAVIGQEGASRTVVVTGGGSVVETARTGRLAAVSIAGGGALHVAGSEGAQRQIVVTGAGAVSLAQTTSRSGATQIHGGGQSQVTGTRPREGAVAVSGGGAVAVAGVVGPARVIVEESGVYGSSYLRRVTTPERHRGSAHVTGNGWPSVNGEKGVLALVAITGNGETHVLGRKRHPLQLQAALMSALAA
jgi:hypothetical protein